MTFLELLWKIFLYVIVAPVLTCVGIIYAPLVLTLGLLAAPLIAIVSLFYQDPYTCVGTFYMAILMVAIIPFKLLKDLIEDTLELI